MSYVIFLTFTSFIIPMAFILYYHFFIIRTVHTFHKKMRSSNNRFLAIGFTEMISTESKINRMAITSVLIWLLAWTPYTVVCLIGQFGPRHLVTPLVSQIPSLSAKICTVFNSVIFGFCHPNVQKAIKKNFPGLFNNEEKKGKKLTDATTLSKKI